MDPIIEPTEILPPPRPAQEHSWKLNPAIRRWLPMIGVGIGSSLLVLVVAGAIVWTHRGSITRSLLASVVSPQTTAADTTTSNPLAALLAPAATPTPSTGSKDLSVTDVVAKANPSVVSIEVSQVPTYTNPFQNLFPGFDFVPTTPQSSTPQVVGGGSGFFVTSDGLVVTNRHVVDFANATFVVITSDGKRYPATVLSKDPVLDIAVLKVSGGSRFSAITLGDSDTLQLGQSVVAIGFALGQFKNSISVGVISGLSRSITAGDESGSSELLDKVIQTDAAINPGNSGGPLLNLRGEVIGVDVAVAQGSQNIGFALPINSVKQAILSVERTGTIARPYVGIRYTSVTPAMKAQNNLPVDYGVIISSGTGAGELAVIPGSPADRAGLVENDIILSIDGVKLDANNNFASIIRNKAIGQKVTFDVLSKGIRKNVVVTLGQAPNS